MLRTFLFCMPFLLAAGTAAADGATDDAAVPREHAVRQEQPRAEADVKGPAAKPEGEARGADPKANSDARKADPKVAGDVKMSGMSILGNDDAPKSLVIVPWKSSRLGDMPGLSRLLDDSTQPVDKDVFMRELAYYRIRSESK